MEYALVLMNRPPAMGQIVPLSCGHLVDRKYKGVNPEKKSGVQPRRWICDQTDTPLAASAAELVPNVLGFHSFGAYQQRRDKRIVIIAPNKTKGKHKVPALKLGTWNVRTMTPGLQVAISVGFA